MSVSKINAKNNCFGERVEGLWEMELSEAVELGGF
jgi:hypothetical protein